MDWLSNTTRSERPQKTIKVHALKCTQFQKIASNKVKNTLREMSRFQNLQSKDAFMNGDTGVLEEGANHWTDETEMNFQQNYGKRKVWKGRETTLNPNIPHSGGSDIMQICMAARGTGSLGFILTADKVAGCYTLS